MNRKYVSNYSIKPIVDDKNVSRIFIWFVTKKQINDIRVSGVLTAKPEGSTEFIEVIKGSIDYCNLASSFIGQIALKFYLPLLQRYGNITVDCPFKPGSRYIDFPLGDLLIPDFIPKAWQARLGANIQEFVTYKCEEVSKFSKKIVTENKFILTKECFITTCLNTSKSEIREP
jgi:hypothetical protein